MLVGAAGYVALAPVLSELAGMPAATPGALACGAVVAAGAALAPDIDTPNSKLGHTVPGIALVVGKLFGGHRNGTHSLLFCALGVAITALALSSTSVLALPDGREISSGTIVALLVAYASLKLLLGSVLAVRDRQERLVLAIAGVAVGAALEPGTQWIPAAVGVGCLLHLAGDWLTPEGVEPFWPFSPRRFSLPLIGRTGDAREALVVLLIVLAGAYAGYQQTQAHSDAPAVRSARPD